MKLLIALVPALIAATLAPAAAESQRLVEAPLPAGFVEPAEPGQITIQTIPAYRAVQGASFQDCFRHIDSNNIPMTAPVVMTMQPTANGKLNMEHMRFLYPSPTDGSLGEDGRVEVVDVPARQVVSMTLRGTLSDNRRDQAAFNLIQHVKQADPPLEITGPVEVLGYNSPFALPWKKLWTVQFPVAPVATQTN